MSCPRVLVIMATYNGQKWLEEQLMSIQAQEGVEVFIRVYDDRSTDATFAELQAYAAAHPNVKVSQNQSNLGPAINFMQGVWDTENAGYDYYAFSDQDDVWLPKKLKHAIELIEASAPHPKGCLYYSDHTNVDETLGNPERAIHIFEPCSDSYLTPLIKNWVAGCTMVFDESLRNLLAAHPLSKMDRLHDVWVHLVARFCADVVADFKTSYILRRITGENVVGREHYSFESLSEVSDSVQRMFTPASSVNQNVAHDLLSAYGSEMSEQARVELQRFVGYREKLGDRLALVSYPAKLLPSRQMSAVARLKFLLGRW